MISKGPANLENQLYRRVAWRLIPLLFVGYVVAYLNRVNVGFAKLQMIADLKFSDTVYGLGAGVFFIGYFLFEVPSNVLLHRLGARSWIARIMISWGLISAAAMFVRTPAQFYFSRFVLGLAEAGFFPGIILYLTYWFPVKRRAQITAFFISAIGFSGLIGGPLSGWIMQRLAGAAGYAGWQWLFVLEAIPSLVIGGAILAWLPDRIRDAGWLTADEKGLLTRAVAAEDHAKEHLSIGAVLAHPRIWGFGCIYFTLMTGLYGISFWMPQIIRNAGMASMLGVGFVSAIPYAVAIAAMIAVGRHSDRTGERFWHLVLCLVAAGLGFGLIGLGGGTGSVVVAGLVLATSGVLCAMPLFWTFPAALLEGAAAAAGIALINSLGNLGGFASPYLVGALNDFSHSQQAGLYAVAISLLLGAMLAGLLLRPGRESPLRE